MAKRWTRNWLVVLGVVLLLGAARTALADAPEGSRGVVSKLRAMETALRKETGAEVIYDPDPARLVDRLLDRYQSQEYVCPCRPGGRPDEGAAPGASRPGTALLRAEWTRAPGRPRQGEGT